MARQAGRTQTTRPRSTSPVMAEPVLPAEASPGDQDRRGGGKRSRRRSPPLTCPTHCLDCGAPFPQSSAAWWRKLSQKDKLQFHEEGLICDGCLERKYRSVTPPTEARRSQKGSRMEQTHSRTSSSHQQRGPSPPSRPTHCVDCRERLPQSAETRSGGRTSQCTANRLLAKRVYVATPALRRCRPRRNTGV